MDTPQMLKEENMKTCSRCGEEKPATPEYFHRDRGRSDGLHRYCKPCGRAKSREWKNNNPDATLRHALNRRTNLTVEEFRSMVADQDDLCAICGDPPTQRTRLCVDHDHESGEVRGLLCHSCNLGLGHLGDTLEAAQNAVDYLKEN